MLVPNAPCGVESGQVLDFKLKRVLFLMHRVELKVIFLGCPVVLPFPVPNAPCGVERFLLHFTCYKYLIQVPNAPCGVESWQVYKSHEHAVIYGS